MGIEPAPRCNGGAPRHGPEGTLRHAAPTKRNTSIVRPKNDAVEPELSPMSKKVRSFDKYSRKNGRWSWKRPSYERGIVSLIKAERRVEDGIASALTEVEAVEAGLRYFDELIMPQNKNGASGSAGSRHQPKSTEENEEMTALDGRNPPRQQPGPQSTGGRRAGQTEGGGFSRSQAVKLRGYAVAKTSAIGRGSRITTSGDRAVSKGVDLKLTLKQRLDNYDRQRGINIRTLNDYAATKAPFAPVIEPSNKQKDSKHNGQKGSSTVGSKIAIAAVDSGGNHGGGVFAPCCEGGALDAGSVGGILARSLGYTAAAKGSRNVPQEKGEGRGRVPGSDEDNKDKPARSRWRSWNEAPPPALLTAEESRKFSAVRREGERRQQPPPSEVVAEIMPPFKSRQRIRSSSANNVASNDNNGAADATAVSLVSQVVRLRGGDKHGSGSEGAGPVSTTSPSSSRRKSTGAIPLVPRVAMLAAPLIIGKNRTGAARKGKDFDPDQLECVRRHEASVAERERIVHSIRTEAEKKTVFRALPLPAFLDDDGAPDAAGGFARTRAGGGGGNGDRGGRGSTHKSTLGAVGTSPQLLAALEHDEEAKELVEKIRKLNPSANIASIVLQSTPRTPLTSRTKNNRGGATRHLSSMGATPAATDDASVSASSASTPLGFSENNAETGPLTMSPLVSAFLPSGAGAGAAKRSAQSHACLAGAEEGEERGGGQGGHPTWAAGNGTRSPDENQARGTSKGEGLLVCHRETSGTAASATAQPADLRGDQDEDSGDGRGIIRSRRRSLMGKMLESSMLERQKEWAKARSRKVLESRRQVEEAKEQERKGDILDAGLSGRSWSKAKTEHLRSLERQREEEETREQIREARRRASQHRAERERESAKRRATEIAETLTTAPVAEGTGRESRTAPNSRGGAGRRRARRPRRARSHAGDAGDVDRADGGGDGGGSGNIPTTCDARRHTRDEESPLEKRNYDAPTAGVESNNDLSEDSFYRLAVETIVERERLGATGAGVRVGSGRVTLGVVGDSGYCGDRGGRSGVGVDVGGHRGPGSGRSRCRAKNGAAADRHDTAAGRKHRKSEVPRHQRRGGCTGGLSLDKAAGRRHADVKPTKEQGRYSSIPSASSSARAVARTSSLLSLYEAQSVEHVSGRGVGSGGGRNNSVLTAEDDSARLEMGGSAIDPSYGPTTGGSGNIGVRNITTFSRLEQQVLRNSEAGECTTAWGEEFIPSEAAARGRNYPLSGERRETCGHGSGGRARRPAEGGDVLDETSAAFGKDPRWGDVLSVGDELEHSDEEGAYQGKQDPRRHPVTTRIGALGVCRDRDMGASMAYDDSRETLRSVSGKLRAGVAGASQSCTDDAVEAPPHAKDNNHGLDGYIGGGVDGGGHGRVGDRLSLWSSSGDDANVTEIGGNDEHGHGEGEDGYGAPNRESQACGRKDMAEDNGDAVRVTTARGGCEIPVGEAFPHMTAPAGVFFDPVTSSADKGRLKVRDPRLFDPCSMRRRPDFGATPARTTVQGSERTTAGQFAEGRGASPTGVTLLLGCRADDHGGSLGDADRAAQQVDRAEQVITVMFDRSKFNAEEARRWWLANRTRIINIGDR